MVTLLSLRNLLASASVLAIVAGAGLLLGYRLNMPETVPAPDVPSHTVPAIAPEVPTSDPVVGATPADPRARSVRVGKTLATVRIPALWTDGTEYAAIEGIRPGDLDRGLGHYPMTPLPGQRGNVAFAGHRWQGPLYDFERLDVGDRVIIEQGKARWVYRLISEPQIIETTDVWVIDPVPGHERARMLTLTTCWPKNGSSHREFVRARLIERNAR